MSRNRPKTSFTFSFCFCCINAGCSRLKQWAYQGIDRDQWQQPDKVITTLQIPPGAEIADLGAGGGYFTFHLAKAVGPNGKVYAVDIDRGTNQLIARTGQERWRR